MYIFLALDLERRNVEKGFDHRDLVFEIARRERSWIQGKVWSCGTCESLTLSVFLSPESLI